MSPGEDTLDALVGSILMTECAPRGKGGKGTRESPLVVDDAAYLDKYIHFFTTPGTHNDVYAATAHRMFFGNFAKGNDKFQCAANDGHNTDAICGLINVVPLAMAKVLSLVSQQQPVQQQQPSDASLESLSCIPTTTCATTTTFRC